MSNVHDPSLVKIGIPADSRRRGADRPDRSAGNGVHIDELAADLRRALSGEVRFDSATRGLYATDASNFRQVPLGVVIPKTLDDVVLTHRICHAHGAPIVNRGAGTSLSGETVNVAVVIEHSKYLRHIGRPDPDQRLITVQTGAINQKVNIEAGRVGLIFGPDPSTHRYCTIGGNIGNNSCGVHSVQSQFYGPGPRTSDNVEAMEIVTYDGARFWVGVNEENDLDRIIAAGGRKGEIYRQLRDLRDRYADEIRARYVPVDQLPRRVSGFNLDELLPERGFNVARALVGTEGTCVTALQVTLKLTPALLERTTVVIAYDDICAAGDAVPDILSWKPIGLEAIDDILFRNEKQQHMNVDALERLPRPGDNAWLLVQFGADERAEVEDTARSFKRWLVESKGYQPDRVQLYLDDQEERNTEALWQVREGGLGATAFPPHGDDYWPGWEDAAVSPSQVGPYLRDLKALYRKHDLDGAIYGHLGQGCIHSRISFDLHNAEGVAAYRAFLDEASDLVVSYGGSLSGEHGDGQQRAEFLSKQYGQRLVDAMCEFKRIWDPDWKMNPGKVVDPYGVDQNLRLGTNYEPSRPEVKFAYPQDGGDFGHAALRCVGVGKCRQPEGVDVMCPSYVVTREEKHTTRGRARLLFEMLQGEVITDGWRSREVYDALDLCLSCKGCTSECPVQVDMPTYKAEFLYHHFQSPRRNRKRHMYAFGFIDKLARLASLVPEAANFVSQTPGLADLAKLVAGVDRRRSLPPFAPMSLQSWFRRRGGTRNPSGPKVILWPDTFNNYFHTEVGIACVEGLEAAGYQVLMPDQHVCCGRPLYEYGFLDSAERYLRRTLDQLRDEIRAGTPVVGMEPSCTAVFRHELTHILPHDEDAARLARSVFHFSEFVAGQNIELPRIDGEAVVWGHCHQKATGGMGPELELLEQMGLRSREAKGGCCGLAGAWGFEPGKYDISMQCAEAGLIPAIDSASSDALIVADGFSCKTQLEHTRCGRRALHTAEVIQMARQQAVTPGERLPVERPAPPLWIRAVRTAAVIALGAVTAAALYKGGQAVRRKLG